MKHRRGAPPAPVFADSSAYCALVVARDRNHQAARALLHRLTAGRRQLVTTNLVLAETYALILNRTDRAHGQRRAQALALQAIRQIYASAQLGGARLEYVTPADEVSALHILDRYQDKSFSFTDATSFAVMVRLQLSVAFTFDDDFRQFGFTQLTDAVLDWQ